MFTHPSSFNQPVNELPVMRIMPKYFTWFNKEAYKK